jgi:uncharacterized protein (DUF885 family)
MKLAAVLLGVLFLLALSFPSAAAPPAAGEAFGRLADEFLRGYLALSPISATQAGYHQHTDPKSGQTVNLDERLDDVSPAGIAQQRAFFENFRRRLRREIKVGQLDPETRADYELIRDVIELSLFELNEVESHKHKPQAYVEALGQALFSPLVLEYAPAEKRFEHITARLEQVPEFLAAAKVNLVDAAPVFLETAIEENQGNIGLIQGPIRAMAPAAGPTRERFDRAAARAVAALEEFNRWLDADFRPHATADWRLGGKLYARKFRLALGTDLKPQSVLVDAESELARVRREMLRQALPLHAEWFPGHGDHSDLVMAERESRVVREVLDRIAQEHVSRDALFDQVRRDVAELQAYLVEKSLLTLIGRENLQVIETPAFLRGALGVAAFQPAPPLQPELGAFFYVTPISEKATAEQAESKLREYNNFMLKILTIHEALPGHYIQFEHAAGIRPEWRRLLRSVLGNGPNVEGWAAYTQDMVLEAGYRGGDPRLALTNNKMLLRVAANAILDVRLQTAGMTDEQALDLMMNRCFQERAEAEGKLRRAKLTSAQLPTYFVGWREWWRLRRDLERQQIGRFSLQDFHDRALAAGAVNLRSMRRLLLAR